jgi:hypothetical protein
MRLGLLPVDRLLHDARAARLAADVDDELVSARRTAVGTYPMPIPTSSIGECVPR